MSTLSSFIFVFLYCAASSLGAETTQKLSGISTDGLYFSREVFTPQNTFKTFGTGEPIETLSARDEGGPTTLTSKATEFVKTQLDLDDDVVHFRSGYTSRDSDEQYAWLTQHHNGVPFVNAVANVAFKGDNVTVFGSSFVKAKTIDSSVPELSAGTAISRAEAALNGKHNGIPANLAYLAQEDGSAALVYGIQIQNTSAGIWLEAYVNAHSGEVVSARSFVSHFRYTVVPLWKNNVLDGEESLVDPYDKDASPLGWHAFNDTKTNSTSGNNVIVFTDTRPMNRVTKTIYELYDDRSNVTTQSSEGVFDYPYNSSADADVPSNTNASRVNAFYLANSFHDFTYKYGFTEEAFNFQNDNFGKGGLANDSLWISVQDSSSIANGGASVPPDGQSGLISVGIYPDITPSRDGAMETDLMIHELTHTLNWRMGSGGTGACFNGREGTGLDEAFADSMADWNSQRSAVITDYVASAYSNNRTLGIRSHPYSVDRNVNPYNYSDSKDQRASHRRGEPWANLLHNVHAALTKEYGWSNSARTNPDGTEGNIVWAHLFVDALRLLPCTPLFVDARDAWIQADHNRYKGANKCLLWKVFASRGLGLNAKDFVDDFTLPVDCQKE